MFDIGFWEILLIGVVTLLVVGPRRLPAVAVFAGHWFGRIQRFVRNMRDEITEELETEHLKNLVNEQKSEIDELRRDVQAARSEVQRAFDEVGTEYDTDPFAEEKDDPTADDETVTAADDDANAEDEDPAPAEDTADSSTGTGGDPPR